MTTRSSVVLLGLLLAAILVPVSRTLRTVMLRRVSAPPLTTKTRTVLPPLSGIVPPPSMVTATAFRKRKLRTPTVQTSPLVVGETSFWRITSRGPGGRTKSPWYELKVK